MSEITLRTSTRADIPAIDWLLGDSYPVLLKPDYPASVLVTALPLIARARPELVMSGTYYVAQLRGRVLAAGGWTPETPTGGAEKGQVGHIRHVVTHPTATRRGLAGALMRHSFDKARAAGMRGLVCLSTRTAVPFYEAVGFAVEREVTLELRPCISFPAVRMLRGLSSKVDNSGFQ